jgi:hypothetical protein
VAALAEILAYYVPGVDNLLDTLATPAALVAGTVVSAAVTPFSLATIWLKMLHKIGGIVVGRSVSDLQCCYWWAKS